MKEEFIFRVSIEKGKKKKRSGSQQDLEISLKETFLYYVKISSEIAISQSGFVTFEYESNYGVINCLVRTDSRLEELAEILFLKYKLLRLEELYRLSNQLVKYDDDEEYE